MLNTVILKAHIATRAEEFLHELFGGRVVRNGTDRWRIGNKGSLAVSLLTGGIVYFDHETGLGGDCFDLWARERGGTFTETLRACAEWAGIEESTPRLPASRQKPAALSNSKLSTRPEPWPMMDATHSELWRSGVSRLESDAEARTAIANWRGWQRDALISLARAGLISAPQFNLWPNVIKPQFCVCFPVLHPRIEEGDAISWHLRPVHLHIRFHPGATRLDGAPISWIYAPTMKKLGVNDGGNAPLVIARLGRDPEQPALGIRCRCVIICAGEWDAITVLLAAWWINDHGALLLPPGLAIVGIRGEGRSGTDAYLRHYSHWRPDSVILLADADNTGLAWFKPTSDGRPGFAERLQQRGAKVLRRVPKKRDGIKDVSDLYRAGLLGLPDVETMLSEAGFDWKGARQ